MENVSLLTCISMHELIHLCVPRYLSHNAPAPLMEICVCNHEKPSTLPMHTIYFMPNR